MDAEERLQVLRKTNLARIITTRNDASGRGGVARVAEELDMTSGYISQLLKPNSESGSRPITGKTARKIERLLHLGEFDLDKPADKGGQVVDIRSKTDTNIVEIPRLAVNASMGAGELRPAGHADVVERMSVSREWLNRNVAATNQSNLALITAYGDSMEGTFSDGDLLMVDTGITEIKVDAVYVLALGDELYIKRLQRRPDGVLLMLSDNPRYAPYEIKNGDLAEFQVLGRVLLAWNARKL